MYYLLSFRIYTGENDIKLEVNTAFPGVMVEYTEKGRSQWKTVTSETTIPPRTEIELRTKYVYFQTRYTKKSFKHW